MRSFFLFLYTAFASLAAGTAAFLVSFRWFPIAEMLRSICVGLPLLGFLLLLPPKAAAVAVALAALPLFGFAFASVAHIVLYGSDISSAAMHSVLETSAMESLEFIGEYVTLPNICIAAALCVAFALLLRRAFYAAKTLPRNRLTVFAALLLICVPAWFAWHKGDRLLRSYTPYVISKTFVNYRQDLEKVRALRDARKNLHFSDVTLLDGESAESRTYVFIIGESANRHHLALYGYRRPTTPELDALAREGMLVFRDVASASTHTIPSLRATLLFHGLDGDKDILEARSLIGLFNDAGFETYWLSNQTASADGLTGTAVIAGDARHAAFLNRAAHEGKSTSHDGVLLPALRETLRAPAQNKAIFLHLIGSHLSYGLRYPEEFSRFTDTADIPDAPWRSRDDKKYVNEYDNSLLYTDHIVGQVMRMVAQAPGRNFVIYFSDHGQEVYDTRPMRGQDARNPTRNMLDVPFVCMLSQGYLDANTAFARQLQEAADKPFSLANFAQSAAQLARIGFDGFSGRDSLFSPDYRPGKRKAPGGGDYDDLPVLENR